MSITTNDHFLRYPVDQAQQLPWFHNTFKTSKVMIIDQRYS